MRKLRHLLIILIALLAISIAGCVQPAGDEVAPVEIGSQATWTITPSETSTPTVTPTPTATDPSNIEPTATEILVTPTDAQSAFVAQSAATEVADAALQDDTVPLENQQPVNQASEFELTATALVAGATLTQEAMLTATAAASGIGVVTPTPLVTGFPTADPFVATATPFSVVQPGQDCTHEVREQDRSLYRLSLAYGVPVMDIARASGIVNPDLIRVGQRLTIPGCGTTGGIPPATSTPSPAETALNTGTGGVAFVTEPTGDCSWGTTVQFPGGCGTTATTTTTTTTANTAGTGGPTTTTASRVHVVQQGETLFEISLLYGVSVADIANLNGISNYDNITFNDELLIP